MTNTLHGIGLATPMPCYYFATSGELATIALATMYFLQGCGKLCGNPMENFCNSFILNGLAFSTGNRHNGIVGWD